MAVTGCLTIFLIALVAIGAPLISMFFGISPEDQNVLKRYQPVMTKLEISTDTRESVLENFIEADPARADAIAKILQAKGLADAEGEGEDETEDIIFSLFENNQLSQIKVQLAPLVGNEIGQLKKLLEGFSTTHLLGTDELGRDVLMRLIFGARISIGVGVLVALFAAIVGLIVGSVAGFFGGKLDTILMRGTDSLLSLPLLPLLIVLAAVDLSSVPVIGFFIQGENQSLVKLVFILCLFSWMTVARLIRGSILSIKEREFVQAAYSLGASNFRIIAAHIIPNVLAPLLVAVTLNVGQAILFEAALSFLGLGIQPPTPSWGNMLFNAQELIHEAPLLAVFPGILILITVMSFNFLGDGLQDAIDPRALRRA